MVRRIQDKLSIDAKQVFNENEPVILNASFYNEAFELVPNLDINLLLENEEGKEFKYAFSDFGNAYRLDMGRLPAVNTHMCKNKVRYRDFSANGNFSKESECQALVTTAGIRFNQLAERNRCQSVISKRYSKHSSTLEQNSSISNVAYKSEKLHTITDLWIIFVLILLLAAAEWSLRKYWGGY
jgi:hypothetical protein